MRAWSTAVATLALACLSQTGQAADEAPTGSAEAGQAKAATCTACHGLNGVGNVNPEWPVIAGQSARYVFEQTRLIRDGARPVPLMQPIVQDLTDQDLADLAAFFSQQVPTGGEADPSYWQEGERLYKAGDPARGLPPCTSCHGPVGRGAPANGFPALRAQHSVYTQKTLNDYAASARYLTDDKGQLRGGPHAAIMATIAERLTPEDRRNLASYIQGMR